MHNWRITKYDPQNRNIQGYYLKNEWTSYSDIGRVFTDGQFTIEDYLKIEDAYINAITSFMKCMHLRELKIIKLEKHNLTDENALYSENIAKVYNTLKNGQLLTKEMVEIVSKLILREFLWCKLESNDMYVHFGYDYYMYIGSKKPCNDVIVKIRKSGLFVEALESPYKD